MRPAKYAEGGPEDEEGLEGVLDLGREAARGAFLNAELSMLLRHLAKAEVSCAALGVAKLERPASAWPPSVGAA